MYDCRPDAIDGKGRYVEKASVFLWMDPAKEKRQLRVALQKIVEHQLPISGEGNVVQLRSVLVGPGNWLFLGQAGQHLEMLWHVTGG